MLLSTHPVVRLSLLLRVGLAFLCIYCTILSQTVLTNGTNLLFTKYTGYIKANCAENIINVCNVQIVNRNIFISLLSHLKKIEKMTRFVVAK